MGVKYCAWDREITKIVLFQQQSISQARGLFYCKGSLYMRSAHKRHYFVYSFFLIYFINFVYILSEETSKEVYSSPVLSNLSFARAM